MKHSGLDYNMWQGTQSDLYQDDIEDTSDFLQILQRMCDVDFGNVLRKSGLLAFFIIIKFLLSYLLNWIC